MTTHNTTHLEETLRIAFEDPLFYKLPKGIVRFDYAHTHGWWVRVTRDGASFRKIFSDGQCESFEDGLRKAILYRHEVLTLFPVTAIPINHKTMPTEAENRIDLKTEKGKQQPYVYWEARWYDKDFNIKRKCFSVLKYGNDKARELALNAAKNNHNKTEKPKTLTIQDQYKTNNFRKILRSDVTILATINGNPYSAEASRNGNHHVDDDYPYDFEGEKKYVLHLTIERKRALRNQKIALFLNLHEKLFCELCKFRFIEFYPFLNEDIIEVHHIVPLSTLDESTLVRPEELMLLCANCHLAIHQGNAEVNLHVALGYFKTVDPDR